MRVREYLNKNNKKIWLCSVFNQGKLHITYLPNCIFYYYSLTNSFGKIYEIKLYCFLDIFVPFEHVWINNLHMITLKVMNWIINSFPLKIFESINFKLDFFENFSLVSSERLFSLLVSFHCYVTSFVNLV